MKAETAGAVLVTEKRNLNCCVGQRREFWRRGMEGGRGVGLGIDIPALNSRTSVNEISIGSNMFVLLPVLFLLHIITVFAKYSSLFPNKGGFFCIHSFFLPN